MMVCNGISYREVVHIHSDFSDSVFPSFYNANVLQINMCYVLIESKRMKESKKRMNEIT